MASCAATPWIGVLLLLWCLCLVCALVTYFCVPLSKPPTRAHPGVTQSDPESPQPNHRCAAPQVRPRRSERAANPRHAPTTMAAARLHRLARELAMLQSDPPPGVAAWPVDEADISRFHASEWGWGFVVRWMQKRWAAMSSVCVTSPIRTWGPHLRITNPSMDVLARQASRGPRARPTRPGSSDSSWSCRSGAWHGGIHAIVCTHVSTNQQSVSDSTQLVRRHHPPTHDMEGTPSSRPWSAS